jgi:Collagen triple helix repeat (20 copies)
LHRIASRRPSPATIISLVALFVALGGTSFAAVTLVAKNSVGSPQVINGSLRTVDLSKKARKALKGNRGARGPAGAVGPAGAAGPAGPTGPAGAAGAQGGTGPIGASGATGPAGTPLGYALVNANGTVDPAHSKNVTTAMVRHPAAGQYCFHGLPFTPTNAVATLGSGGLPLPLMLVGASDVIGGFCNVAGDQAGAFIWNQAGSATVDYTFHIWFE